MPKAFYFNKFIYVKVTKFVFLYRSCVIHVEIRKITFSVFKEVKQNKTFFLNYQKLMCYTSIKLLVITNG